VAHGARPLRKAHESWVNAGAFVAKSG